MHYNISVLLHWKNNEYDIWMDLKMHYNISVLLHWKNNEYDIWMDLKDALNLSVISIEKYMIYEWI